MDGMSSARAGNVVSVEGSKPLPKTRTNVKVVEGSTVADRNANDTQFSVEATKAIAAELQNALKTAPGEFSVSVDGESNMIVVRITDRETGEVIKQLPPQELVEGDIRMKKIIGLFVDDQA
tara:strand:- start:105 stop:467 length:363 start_codon:yes stop_codon:yes gene_type:complete